MLRIDVERKKKQNKTTTTISNEKINSQKLIHVSCVQAHNAGTELHNAYDFNAPVILYTNTYALDTCYKNDTCVNICRFVKRLNYTLWESCYMHVQCLTHFSDKLPSLCSVAEESNCNFRYVWLCDLDIPKEKWLQTLSRCCLAGKKLI